MGKYRKRCPKVIECEPTVVQTRKGPRLVDRAVLSTPSISSTHSSPSKKRALSPTFLYADDDLPNTSGHHTLQSVPERLGRYAFVSGINLHSVEYLSDTE
jgi:hypothetical protein